MSADDENRFRPKPGRIRSDTPKDDDDKGDVDAHVRRLEALR